MAFMENYYCAKDFASIVGMGHMNFTTMLRTFERFKSLRKPYKFRGRADYPEPDYIFRTLGRTSFKFWHISKNGDKNS